MTADLAPFNGENGRPLYVGVNGKVFDVTEGADFYGAGGPYHAFTGRDATVMLGKMEASPEGPDLSTPVRELHEMERDTLYGWVS